MASGPWRLGGKGVPGSLGFEGNQYRTGTQKGLQRQLHASQVALWGPGKDLLLLLLPSPFLCGLRMGRLPSTRTVFRKITSPRKPLKQPQPYSAFSSTARIPSPRPAFQMDQLLQREAPPSRPPPLSSLQLLQEASRRAGSTLEGVAFWRGFRLPREG